ncbi:6781_t:CDS:2 [Ambispora leptoticha]|uniref:6781_t:CDS:1 n=1 Tax=Ambispora leptoticha TaxID=144679 RepID=A0A9N9F0C5_9GLOM|nr:6781_t:CDS:2 [Ambispora leptoticha]
MNESFLDTFGSNRREREERERRDERFRRERDDRPYFREEHSPQQNARNSMFPRNTHRQRTPIDYEDMDRIPLGGSNMTFGERRIPGNALLRNNNPELGSNEMAFSSNDRERKYGERYIAPREPRFRPMNNSPFNPNQNIGGHQSQHEMYYHREREYPRHNRYRDWDGKEEMYRRSNNYNDKSRDEFIDYRYDRNLSRDNSADSEKLSLAARHNHWRASRRDRRSPSSSTRSTRSSRSPPTHRRIRSNSISRSLSPQNRSVNAISRESSPRKHDLDRFSSKRPLKFSITKLPEKNHEFDDNSKQGTEDGYDDVPDAVSVDDLNNESSIVPSRALATHEEADYETRVNFKNSTEEELASGGENSSLPQKPKNSDRGGWTGWHSIEGGSSTNAPDGRQNEESNGMDNVSEKSLDMDLSPNEEKSDIYPEQFHKEASIEKNDPINDKPPLQLDVEETIVKATIASTSESLNQQIKPPPKSVEGKENHIKNDNISGIEAQNYPVTTSVDDNENEEGEITSERNESPEISFGFPRPEDASDEETTSIREDLEQMIEDVEDKISKYEEFLETIQRQKTIIERKKSQFKVNNNKSTEKANGNAASTNRNINDENNIQSIDRPISSSARLSHSCHLGVAMNENSRNQNNHVQDDASTDGSKALNKQKLSLWELIYQENRLISEKNELSSAPPRQVYNILLEYPIFKKTIEDKAFYEFYITQNIIAKKLDLEEKEKALKNQYKMLYESWVQKNEKLEKLAGKKKKPEKLEVIAGPSSEETAGGNNRSLAGRAYRRGDAARSEAELKEIIKDLEAAELRNPELRARRTLATIPSMILDIFELETLIFDDSNRIVVDPTEFYEIKRDTLSDWKPEEIEKFKNAYSEYPKQFGKIADLISSKTTNQCVEFYYLNKKKLIDFKALVSAKGNTKKRKGPGRRRATNGTTTSPPTPEQPNTRKRNKGSALTDDIGKASSSRRKNKEKEEIQKLEEQQELDTAERDILETEPSSAQIEEQYADNDRETSIIIPKSPLSHQGKQTSSSLRETNETESQQITYKKSNEWQEDEILLFLTAFEKYGNNLDEVASSLEKPKEECERFYICEYLSSQVSTNNVENENTVNETIVMPSSPPNIEEEEEATTTKKSKNIKPRKKVKAQEEDNEKGKKRKGGRAKKVADDEDEIDEVVATSSIVNEGVARRVSRSEDKGTTPRHSSYWSVKEKTSFQELVKSYGKNFELISQKLGTKTPHQVRNYSNKINEESGATDKNELQIEIHEDSVINTPETIINDNTQESSESNIEQGQSQKSPQQLNLPPTGYFERNQKSPIISSDLQPNTQSPVTATITPTSSSTSPTNPPITHTECSSMLNKNNNSSQPERKEEIRNINSEAIIERSPQQGKRTIFDLLNPTDTETMDATSDNWFDGSNAAEEKSSTSRRNSQKLDIRVTEENPSVNRSNGPEIPSIAANQSTSVVSHPPPNQASPVMTANLNHTTPNLSSPRQRTPSMPTIDETRMLPHQQRPLMQMRNQQQSQQPPPQQRRSLPSNIVYSQHHPIYNNITQQQLNQQHLLVQQQMIGPNSSSQLLSTQQPPLQQIMLTQQPNRRKSLSQSTQQQLLLNQQTNAQNTSSTQTLVYPPNLHGIYRPTPFIGNNSSSRNEIFNNNGQLIASHNMQNFQGQQRQSTIQNQPLLYNPAAISRPSSQEVINAIRHSSTMGSHDIPLSPMITNIYEQQSQVHWDQTINTKPNLILDLEDSLGFQDNINC